MSKFSFGKVKRDEPKSAGRFLARVFIAGFLVTLLVQIIVLALMLTLGPYLGFPNSFGIGLGSFQLAENSQLKLSYQSLVASPFLALLTGLLNIFWHIRYNV